MRSENIMANSGVGNEVDPVSVHWTEEGGGPTVVLSHALGMDLHSWDRLASSLAKGNRVLRYDHRGHGASPAPSGPYTMDALVDDAAALLRANASGPVVWVGLSMGGMVGLGLAIRHPELLRGLVVAHSCAYYPEVARNAWDQRIAQVYAEGISSIADTVMGRYFHAEFRAQSPEIEAAARATLLSTDHQGYLGCCHAVRNVDWRVHLQTIQCPLLVIAGELDQGVPLPLAEAITASVKGSELVVLQHASHIGPLEQPERFEELVRSFISHHGSHEAA